MSNYTDILLLTTPKPPHLSPRAVQVSENSAPPLGLLCVAAALEQGGFCVRVHDFYQFGGKPKDIIGLLGQYRPKIVGVSTLTSGFHMALRLCRHVKAASPETATVLGGPHATALPEEVVMDPSVDFAVRGEGEQTIVELARALCSGTRSVEDIKSIEGLAFKENGTAFLTAERNPACFDCAPMPARHLVPMKRYLQQGAIVTSRGCMYHCWFCSSVTFATHKYRYRSTPLVLQEMDGLRGRYGVNSFEFIEDTFTCEPDRIRDLCSQLEEREYVWSCQATIPDLIKNPDLTRRMVRAGCRGLFFGIESGNDRVLKTIKHMSREKILSTIDRALAEGIQHLVTSFIIGHPWDTRETIADTVKLILELRQRGAHTPISILVPFPGSPIGKWPERFGVTVHSRDYSDYYYNRALISTKNLSRTDLEQVYLEVLENILSSDVSSREPIGQMSRSRLLPSELEAVA